MDRRKECNRKRIVVCILWTKRNYRSLWIVRINAGARQHGMSYSHFMGLVNKSDMTLNRKVLADLAMNHPAAFKAVVDAVKK